MVIRILVVLAVVCASSSVLEAQHSVVPPVRRSVSLEPPPLPSLPVDADTIAPITLHVSIRGESVRIVRTADRILVATSGREWLFQRNRVDPRRVSACVVEHARRAVVHYEESEVRNHLRFNGWAEVLAFASESARQDRTLTVERVDAGVDRNVLRPPHVRFPDYKQVDLSEWLEK